MQKGLTIYLAIVIIALLSLQSITASQKSDCDAGVNQEFANSVALNGADTNVDGNLVTHTWGCSQCAASYEQCNKNLDAKVLACAQASGFSPTNTCNRDAEPAYYACANAEIACCKPYELTTRCGSLGDTTPAPVANPQKDCLDDGYYYFNGECVGETQAKQICFGKYGITGYPASQTECGQCAKGQVYIGDECITDQKCTGLANMIYDAELDYCVCKQGFAPMASGGCQETTKKYVGIAVPSQLSVTVKGGQSQTLNIPLPASLATKGYGSLTLKPVLESKDDGIKSITFNPASVQISYGGSTQIITVTISADDVDEFKQYGATIRWNGYDDKQLYSGITNLNVNIVQSEQLFDSKDDAETAKKFEELRNEQLPDLIVRWKFGEEQARTLFAKIKQLDPHDSEDIKIMVSFLAYVDAFNSLTNPVGTLLEETGVIPDSGFGPPLVKRSLPFATIDAKLYAQTLIGVVDHGLKLKEAHKKAVDAFEAKSTESDE